MMRSPEQQFNFAKRLPIPELAKVLQGQSDVVDMSIAEMVLRQKIQAQKAQQGMMAAPLAQGPKVVEKDLAAAGIGALPVDVPIGMAEGGITHFDDSDPSQEYAGGGIVAFQGGGQSSLPFASSVGSPLQSNIKPGPGVTFEQVEWPNKFAAAEKAAADAAAASGGRVSFTAALKRILGPAYAAYEMQDLYRKGMAYDTGMGYGDIGEQMTIGTPMQAPRERAVDKVLATSTAGTPQTTQPAAAGTPPAGTEDRGTAAKGPELKGGIADLYGEEALNKLLPAREEPKRTDITRERLNLYRELGVDPDMFKKQMQKVAEEREAEKGERREAGWMRALEAGLGIMGGTSPYALTNIGEGAKAAAKGAMEDLKEFRKLERERKKAESDLIVAENAFKKSGADADLAVYEKRLDKYDTVNSKRAELGFSMAIEKAKADALKEYRGTEQDVTLYKGMIDAAAKTLSGSPHFAVLSIEEKADAIQSLGNRLYQQYKSRGAGTTAPSGARGKVVNGVYVPAGQ